jgi:hypothetical protein
VDLELYGRMKSHIFHQKRRQKDAGRDNGHVQAQLASRFPTPFAGIFNCCLDGKEGRSNLGNDWLIRSLVFSFAFSRALPIGLAKRHLDV